MIYQYDKKSEEEFVEEIMWEDYNWCKERRLEYLNNQLEKLRVQYLNWIKLFKGYPNWFYQAGLKAISPVVKKGKRFKTEIEMWTNPKAMDYETDKITDSDIERIKEIPIDTFLDFSKNNFSKCLWHEEAHASLKYWKQANRLHCFGACGKTFDIIDVYQKLYNCDFIEAVKNLKRY